MANPSGWYPDPDGKPCERFWNGYKWTTKTRPISKPAEEFKIVQKMDKFNKGLEKLNQENQLRLSKMSKEERDAVIAGNRKTMKNVTQFRDRLIFRLHVIVSGLELTGNAPFYRNIAKHVV